MLLENTSLNFQFLFQLNQLVEVLVYCYAYLTDKVFEPACSTQMVYKEGAKDVALSALTGINGN